MLLAACCLLLAACCLLLAACCLLLLLLLLLIIIMLLLLLLLLLAAAAAAAGADAACCCCCCCMHGRCIFALSWTTALCLPIWNLKALVRNQLHFDTTMNRDWLSFATKPDGCVPRKPADKAGGSWHLQKSSWTGGMPGHGGSTSRWVWVPTGKYPPMDTHGVSPRAM